MLAGRTTPFNAKGEERIKADVIKSFLKVSSCFKWRKAHRHCWNAIDSTIAILKTFDLEDCVEECNFYLSVREGFYRISEFMMG